MWQDSQKLYCLPDYKASTNETRLTRACIVYLIIRLVQMRQDWQECVLFTWL